MLGYDSNEMKTFLGLLVVFLVGVVLTLGFLLWHKAPSATGASRSSEAVGIDVVKALATRDDLERRLARLDDRDRSGQLGSEFYLSEADLRSLVTAALAEHPRSDEFLSFVREVRTEIGEGTLEVGVTVDLSAVQAAGLSGDQGEAVNRVLEMLPFLKGRDLYAGVSGQPQARDGGIALGGDVEMQLGFLSLPLEEMTKRLGLPDDRLGTRLAFEVPQFRVDRVEALGDQLLLEIRAR